MTAALKALSPLSGVVQRLRGEKLTGAEVKMAGPKGKVFIRENKRRLQKKEPGE